MKKFTDVIEIDDYEVLTDIGFVDINKVMKTVPYAVYEVHFDNDVMFTCADKHILIDEHNNEVYAMDSLNKNIKTIDGVSKVVSITVHDKFEQMYDLELKTHHKYYTNDVLSHNTTTVAAYLLHLALFNKNYNIAILANKKNQASEVLDRIKTMYEQLPWWMQAGVRRWNVRDILLDLGPKGTSIFTESTSGSSIRGKTVNCLTGETLVTIQDKKSKEEYFVTLEELEDLLNGKELYTKNN